MEAGVKIFEYTPGFIHSKNVVADDEFAVVGTINFDYRSLVHHYENAVLMYHTESIPDIKKDFEAIFEVLKISIAAGIVALSKKSCSSLHLCSNARGGQVLQQIYRKSEAEVSDFFACAFANSVERFSCHF